MYVIDARHYLDDKGDIAAKHGPMRLMANFVTAVIAHASNFDRPEGTRGPACLTCKHGDESPVQSHIADDGAIAWDCVACGKSGRISNWEGTFWDLSSGMPEH